MAANNTGVKGPDVEIKGGTPHSFISMEASKFEDRKTKSRAK